MSEADKQNLVVLVDKQGEITGYEEKLKAHQTGMLHLAFSIFIMNSCGQMLIQQRSYAKYHFAGMWSNTCCSHPFPGEDLTQAAHRRLREEMGFDTLLTKAFSFIYKSTDKKSGLTEHELDYVFTGVYDGVIEPDIHEIQSYRWETLSSLYTQITARPETFTEWFRIGLYKLKEKGIFL
jgi:isopentenyl-diphosphate delta-isomerase